jgi:hypothetical protein
MQDNPKPLQRPLVIIGGFLDVISSPYYAHYFSGITENTKIIPVSVGLCGSFDECRQKVLDEIQKECPSSDPEWTTKVDVIGFSLGGLVARYAAAPDDKSPHLRRLNIARLFTISSPHTGATLADYLAVTEFHRQMRPGSDFLKHLSQYDRTASYQIICYVHLHDEIVGDHHAAPYNETPYWLDNPWPLLPHFAATIDSRIIADICLRLRGEKPFTTPPPAPLPS